MRTPPTCDPSASDRLSSKTRGNRVDYLGPTHWTYGSAAHGAWRTQCEPAAGTIAWTDFREGFDQPVATCQADVRAIRLWNGGGNRPGFGRMELRRLRGSHHRRDPREAPRLGTIPRRLPGGRIASPGRCAGRSGSEPGARSAGRCATVFERAFHSGTGDALDWA